MATKLCTAIFIIIINKNFAATEEKVCNAGRVCIPLSQCKFEADDDIIFPCHHALRYVCCPEESSISSPGIIETRKKDVFPADCGVVDYDDKISGGEIANLAQFPWMALLGYKQRAINYVQYLCGGSLITDRHVLTAAHCLHLGQNFELFLVRLGELDLSTEIDCVKYGDVKVCGEKHVDILVENAIGHEKFNDQNFENDIALIRLKNTVRFTEYIIPICLPFERNFENANFAEQAFSVSGWGKTTTSSVGGSQVLMYTKLNVWDHRRCNDSLPPEVKPIHDTQICASGQKKEDACKGDSGGPFFNVTKDIDGQFRYFQVGIVSFSPTFVCGSPKSPTIFTRIDKYLHWIIDNIS